MSTETPQPKALRPKEAAAQLSMSLRSFQRHVQPRLKVVRVGGIVLVPVRELERFVATARLDGVAGSKAKRELTEEQREAVAERLRRGRASGV